MNDEIKEKIKNQLLSELEENAHFNNEASLLVNKVIQATGDISDELLRDILFTLATIRNRNLISAEEQQKLKNTVVGFFGLSVGSNAAITWIMESRADTVKIADPDTVSPSNLNRLVYGWDSIGKRKIDLVKERILSMHPYAEVISATNENNDAIEKFFTDTPPLSVVVDSIDSLDGKILLRKFAKDKKLPLIMATDVGDNVILDIERYDKEPSLAFFLGRAPGIEETDVATLTPQQRLHYVFQIVGFEKNSEAMLDSLASIGKTLKTWPQLGATATIAGGTIATTIKKIILGEDVKSGRYFVSLDDLLVADFNAEERKKRREEKINNLKR